MLPAVTAPTPYQYRNLPFRDDVFDLASFDPAAAFIPLVSANKSHDMAISAAYEILLGGVLAKRGTVSLHLEPDVELWCRALSHPLP